MVSRNKIIFLIAISLVAVALIAIIFWLNDYRRQMRSLADFVPPSAIGYVEINLADEALNKYLANNLRAKDLLEQFLLENDLAANIWRGEVEVDRIGWLAFLGEDGKVEKAWLVHGRDDVRKLESVGLEGYYYAILNDRTAVLSRSKRAMNQVRDYKITDGLLGGEKFDRQGAIFGYLKNDLWRKSMGNLLISNQLLEKYFVLDEQGTINWRLDAKDGKNLQFRISIPVEKNEFKSKSDKKSLSFLALSKKIMVKNFNFGDLGQILENELAAVEDVKLRDLVEYVGNKYKVNVAELYTFFKQRSEEHTSELQSH